jgi:hypothetical protein
MPWLPAHYSLIERLKKSQIVGATPKVNGKAFWFAYFWEECGEKDFLQPVKDQVARMFDGLFALPPQWDSTQPSCAFTITPRGTISWKPRKNAASVDLPANTSLTLLTPNAWDGIADLDLLAVLNQLLHSGFIRVKGTAGTQSPDSGLDVFRSALVGDIGGVHYKLGWRGDSRSVRQITDSGGLINKADSDGYAESVNLRKPWHPFSKVENRADYFYRKNKEDNCLATIVSISTSFMTASVFPLLNADFISDLPLALPQQGDDFKLMSEAHRRILHLVKDNAGHNVVRVADSQQLYLVAVGENYFDTQQAQIRRQGEGQAFPEFAVKSVPETGVLGCVKFVRVHHGLHEHGGLTVLPDRKRSIEPTLDGCRRFCQNQAVARVMYPVVLQMYQDALNAMPFHVKWLPNGHAVVPPLQDDGGVPMGAIASVKDLFQKNLWP